MGSAEGEGGGGRVDWRGRVERDIPNFLPDYLFQCTRQLRMLKVFCWTDKTMVQWVLAPDQVFHCLRSNSGTNNCSLRLQMRAVLSCTKYCHQYSNFRGWLLSEVAAWSTCPQVELNIFLEHKARARNFLCSWSWCPLTKCQPKWIWSLTYKHWYSGSSI